MLVLPKPSGMSSEEWEKAEVEAMNEVVGLYGKTWHFWQVDKGDELPLGELTLTGLSALTCNATDIICRPPYFDGLSHKFGTSRSGSRPGEER